MTLPPGDLLPPVVAPTVGDLGRLDRLAIDARHARAGVVTTGHTDLLPQGVHDLLPRAIVPPLGEVVVDGALGQEVVGKHVPLATRAVEVEDRVDDLPQVDLAGPTDPIDRDQRLNDRP